MNKKTKIALTALAIYAVVCIIAHILLWINYGFWTMAVISTVVGAVFYAVLAIKFSFLEAIDGTWILRYL